MASPSLSTSLSCAIAVVALASGCKPDVLSATSVEGGEGWVRAHVPKGDGWHCAAHDADKETFQFRGVKCQYDAGVVMTAKLYDVDTGDARTAQLFCIQDWRQAYAAVFKDVMTYTHDVVDWHGVPACKVVIDGASTKGPWHLFEIHAPNGRRMLQLTVMGSLPVVDKEQKVVDAWLDNLHYDLRLPGQ